MELAPGLVSGCAVLTFAFWAAAAYLQLSAALPPSHAVPLHQSVGLFQLSGEGMETREHRTGHGFLCDIKEGMCPFCWWWIPSTAGSAFTLWIKKTLSDRATPVLAGNATGGRKLPAQFGNARYLGLCTGVHWQTSCALLKHMENGPDLLLL